MKKELQEAFEKALPSFEKRQEAEHQRFREREKFETEWARIRTVVVLIFHAPLFSDFGTTDRKVLAGSGLPESCPRNGNVPKFPTGSADAIGWHTCNLEIDLG